MSRSTALPASLRMALPVLMSLFGVACAAPEAAPSKDEAPRHGSADGVDICEIWGWYGDGECDDDLGICAEPDVEDCGGTGGSEGTCGVMTMDVELCLADGLGVDECVGVPSAGDSVTSREALRTCCTEFSSIGSSPVCLRVFPSAMGCSEPLRATDLCLADGLDVNECVTDTSSSTDSATNRDVLEACCDAVPDDTAEQVCHQVFPTAERCQAPMRDADLCLADGLDLGVCIGYAGPSDDSATSPAVLEACCDAVTDSTESQICTLSFPTPARCHEPMNSTDLCLADGLTIDECVGWPTPGGDSLVSWDILLACCDEVMDTTTVGVCAEVFGM